MNQTKDKVKAYLIFVPVHYIRASEHNLQGSYYLNKEFVKV